jgi:hypothetical protein
MDYSSVLTDHEKSIGCVARDYLPSGKKRRENERSFFNTNKTTGADLVKARAGCKSQQGEILEFFKRNPAAAMTPSHCHNYLYQNTRTPLTSTRRAISNLTAAGKLRKTKLMRAGLYGKKEYCWQYAPAVYVQKGLF